MRATGRRFPEARAACARGLFPEVDFSDHAPRLPGMGAGFSFTLCPVNYSIPDFFFTHSGGREPLGVRIAGIVVADLPGDVLGFFTGSGGSGGSGKPCAWRAGGPCPRCWKSNRGVDER